METIGRIGGKSGISKHLGTRLNGFFHKNERDVETFSCERDLSIEIASKNRGRAVTARREHGFPSFWNDYLGFLSPWRLLFHVAPRRRPASWISFETSDWLSKRPSTSIPVVVPFPVAVTLSKTGQINRPSRYLALEILAYWYLTKAASSIGHRSDRARKGSGAKFRLTKTTATVFVIYQRSEGGGAFKFEERIETSERDRQGAKGKKMGGKEEANSNGKGGMEKSERGKKNVTTTTTR